jgi:hypothetical protein
VNEFGEDGNRVSSDPILLDTTIVTRGFESSHPDYESTLKAVEDLKVAGVRLLVCPQVIYEFRVIATRPRSSRNGLGMSSASVPISV